MAVLTPYALKEGFTTARWLGPVIQRTNVSVADLREVVDFNNPRRSINRRYNAGPEQSSGSTPFLAKGWPDGALQHGEAFSLPAQKGDVLFDLVAAGALDAGRFLSTPAEIDRQDLEDCHFLWRGGESLWQHLKGLHEQLFGPEPVIPTFPVPVPPVTPPQPPVVQPGGGGQNVLSPAAQRVEELRSILLSGPLGRPSVTFEGDGARVHSPGLGILLSTPWELQKPLWVDLLKTYRRLRAHLGDPRQLPEGE